VPTATEIREQLHRIIGKAGELSLVLGSAEFTAETQYAFVGTLTEQIERELNYLVTECVKDAKKRGE
jgi:hypothetical protein